MKKEKESKEIFKEKHITLKGFTKRLERKRLGIADKKWFALTTQILSLALQGLESREIAKKLSIHPQTVWAIIKEAKDAEEAGYKSWKVYVKKGREFRRGGKVLA